MRVREHIVVGGAETVGFAERELLCPPRGNYFRRGHLPSGQGLYNSRDRAGHNLQMSMYAEKRWRRIRVFEHLAKVITGVQFKDGIEVTENTDNRDAA